MSKAIELAEKLDRQLTMSMFAKREDLYAQMAQDREDAAIAIKSLIAQLEAAQSELAAIRALEPVAWLYRTQQGEGRPIASTQNPMFKDPQDLADFEVVVDKLYALPEQK